MIFRHWLTPLRPRTKRQGIVKQTRFEISVVGRDFGQFEERVLPSVSWVGGATGSWVVAANWSNDSVPTSTTDILINTSAPANITIPAGDVESIDSLTVGSNDTLTITNGSLSITANSTINGNLTLSGGITLTEAAGLTNSGTITVNSPSALTIDGNFSQSAGATLSLPGGGSPSNPLSNQLTNSGFESPVITRSGTTPTGWNSWGSTSLSNQYAFTGAQSVQSSGSNSGLLQSFSVTPGASYTLSADAMTPAASPLTGSQGAYLELIFDNASGTQLSSYAPPNSVLVLSSSSATGGPLSGSVGSQGWNLVSTTAVAPAGAATVYAILATGAYNGSGAGGGTVYFDNAQFGPSIPGPSKVVAGSVSNSGTILVGPTNSVTTSGAFTQTSTGTLDLQLGGAPSSGYYGSLSAATATLAGTLKSDIEYGYIPSTADVFTPMTFASESGAFATYQLPSGAGYQFLGAVTFTNIVVSAVPTTMLTTTVNADDTLANVATNFLGVNLAWWDSAVTTTQTQQMVQAAGLTEYRFPGGSSSDDFHFNVAANYGDSSANTIPQFVQFIQAVGGTGTITLDYGSGSPQEAAAELAYLQGSPTDTTQIGVGIEWSDSANQWQNVNWGTVGYWASLRAASPLSTNDGLNFLRINHAAPFTDIKYWEVGNEEYGGWEVDHHGTAGPGGVSTGAQHDPATYVAFAETFASLAQTILSDAGLPSISIGIDSEDPTGASDNNWTKNVLADGLSIGFVPNFISDHSYMQAPAAESDPFLLNSTVMDPKSLLDWSTRYADYQTLLQTTLGAQAAGVQVNATEFNSVYTDPGKQSTSLVNGLFVAESIGSLLDSGYAGDDVWDLRNGYDTTQNNSESLYGWRNGGDYGILGAGNSPPATGAYVPYPTYFAEQLASKLAQSGGKVVSVTTNYQDFDVYAVMEPNGHLDLLAINTNPAANLTEQFNLTGFQPSGQASFWQYGAAQDIAQSQSTSGASALANFSSTLSLSGDDFTYTLPAYSMTVIDLTPVPIAVTSVVINQDFIPVNGASMSAGVATLVSDGYSGFTAGNQIVVGGFTGAQTGFNGTYTIASVSGNQVSYDDLNTANVSTTTFNTAGYAISANTASGLLYAATSGTAISPTGAQRSMVDSIAYTFNTAVNLAVGTVTLGIGSGTTSGETRATATPNVILTPLNGGTIWVVTFESNSNATVTGHSIADGVYTATLNSSLVTAVSGGTMTTTRPTDTFYRLFGDYLADGYVNSTGSGMLNLSFGLNYLSPAASGYLDFFDYNSDGRVNSMDSGELNLNFGSYWYGFTATI
jgi:alpha-L-arabinofuranosidase